MGEDKENKHSRIVVHPILFALYPVLALLANNIGQVDEAVVIRPILISILLVVILWGLLRLLLGDWERSAIITSLLLFVFFSYGHLYEFLRPVEIMGIAIGRHRFLIPIFIAIIGAVLLWILRKPAVSAVTTWLNLVGVIVIVIPIFQIAQFEIRVLTSPEPSQVTQRSGQDFQDSSIEELPDIYYIILDAYTREDVLRDDFGLDNSAFLDELRELGFFIAGCSQSNYSQTEHSFASTLNFEYLEDLGEAFKPGEQDRTQLFLLIRRNAIRGILEELGYTVIAYETGYAWSEWEDADIYAGPRHSESEASNLRFRLNAFEALLVRSTALSILADASIALAPIFSTLESDPLEEHKERILYVLDDLDDLLTMAGPKFVFAHIVSPHKPYLFQPEGDSTSGYLIPGSQVDDQDPYIVGYRNQILYINDRVVHIVKDIISHSKIPPIIIIQGDHGPDEAVLEERVAILNALYLPGMDDNEFNDWMTPINTFRVILNQYFGYDLEKLNDRSFYSTYDAPFDFLEMPNDCVP